MLRAPRGTEDILPDRIPLWRRLEGAAREVLERYGYEEIRTPIFEQLELFVRGVGDTTDIVEKEMYTLGRAGDELALRPEFTAPVVRAVLQHGLHKQHSLLKLYYTGPAFRYERPQAGRQRQFHQIGVEALGPGGPLLDVETILLGEAIFREVGLRRFRLRLNTLGCAETCRPRYRERLKEAMGERLDQLCGTCQRRFERNLFRILDCKNPTCRELTEDLPGIADSLCDPCGAHHHQVLKALGASDTPFEEDIRLVRGLDYYGRTVYEFQSDDLGAQDALGGGGRYDRLISLMGGPETVGAVGFGLGMERIILALEAQEGQIETPGIGAGGVFVAAFPNRRLEAFLLTQQLRQAGVKADCDYQERSLKSQLRSANKADYDYVLLEGDDEAARGVVQVKHMRGERQQTDVERDHLLDYVGRATTTM